MVGWCLRTFRGRGSHLLLTVLKSLVQPHLDYCNQLWSPCDQSSINRIEQIQKKIVSCMKDKSLDKCNYWEKLKALQLSSKERRRERSMIIFIWKVSQGLVTGYDLPFTQEDTRLGRRVTPAAVRMSAPSKVHNAALGSLRVKGAKIFNLLPPHLRNNNDGDILMFMNHLDLYLENVPDEPTVQGLGRAASNNSLLEQIPLYNQRWQ